MMKKFAALLMLCVMLLTAIPTMSYAKKMEKGVPVWTEETVRQYMADYAEGKSMDRLWGYYDLQIRRYLAPESFSEFLIDLEFLTGDFLGLGSYRCFEEPENKLKTHVLHLCMEKQDLEVYFTHKNEGDDWEVMALEFVPASKEEVQTHPNQRLDWTVTAVSVGEEPYELDGILTLPAGASADQPVPACVLVHDFAATDLDHTVGNTALFRDIAKQFAEMGIATIRYDKRTYAYPDAIIESVGDEVIDDALSAIKLLEGQEGVSDQIIVVGVGLGGMLAPRIASESEGAVKGVIMIGAANDRIINVTYQQEKDSVVVLPKEEASVIQNAVRNIGRMKEEDARELTLFGKNGYYYWDSEQFNAIKYIQKNHLPTYVAQGNRDTEVTERTGIDSYSKEIGPNARFAEYTTFRNLNHLLMNDLSTNPNGESEYQGYAKLDLNAGRTLALWILGLE